VSTVRERQARLPLIVVLAAVVAGALLVGNPASSEPAPSASTVDAVAAPVPGTRSTVWYCPGFPGRAGARSDIYLTNLGDAPATAAVTALVDGGDPVRTPVEVAAGTVTRVEPGALAPGAGATLVEIFAADVVVEEGLAGSDTLAVGPCASDAANRWYFAAGTTVRGVEDWLVLLNPFDEAAVVDVTLLTDTGVQDPAGLTALDVPARSRLVLPVHQLSLRQPLVAMDVRARGESRVVAAQSLVYGPDSGRTGVTLTLGAVARANRWQLADGYGLEGSARTVGIVNPGRVDSEVDVLVVSSDAEVTVDPLTVAVGRRGAVSIQLGGCGEQPAPACVPVPNNVGYSVLVSTTTDVPVVVQDLATYTNGDLFTGAASTLATSAPARRWLFGRAAFSGARSVYLVLVNPGSADAVAGVALVIGGTRAEPDGLQQLTLPPGRRVRVAIDASQLGDGAIVVDADAPIVAERVATKPDEITSTPGIPVRGTAS
jgi:hypothetical protein